MSTVRSGGAAAADPVRVRLSWAWGAVAGLLADLLRLFRAYTLAAAGDSSLLRQSLRRFVNLCGSPSIRLSLLQSGRRGRVLPCFPLLYLRFPPYILRYSLFFG